MPMKGNEQDTYGERIAEIYDQLHPGVLVSDDAVELLAGLAGAGPVLELGVGTGRLAVPLAERGLAVTGVDISQAMLDQLAAKPGGRLVETVRADFGDLSLPGRYRLVVVAADTFFMLTTQERQVGCFASVAKQLTDDGSFVVEAFVPDRARAAAGGVVVRKVTADSVVLGASTHDPANQRIDGAQILVDAGGIRLAPAAMRYAWPSELDLMARLAGLRLVERWGSWKRTPFGSDSLRHISVYRRG
jgi:SAM-dependent methyltransferase